MLEANKVKVKFEYGNEHKLVENPKKVGQNKEYENKHEWVVYVRLADQKEDVKKFI